MNTAAIARKGLPKAGFDVDAFLDSCSRTHQYIIITVVLFFFTLLYGYLQELVCIFLFARQFGLFLTLVQFSGYTLLATLQWAQKGSEHRRTIPQNYKIFLAVGQASMQVRVGC